MSSSFDLSLMITQKSLKKTRKEPKACFCTCTEEEYLRTLRKCASDIVSNGPGWWYLANRSSLTTEICLVIVCREVLTVCHPPPIFLATFPPAAADSLPPCTYPIRRGSVFISSSTASTYRRDLRERTSVCSRIAGQMTVGLGWGQIIISPLARLK